MKTMIFILSLLACVLGDTQRVDPFIRNTGNSEQKAEIPASELSDNCSYDVNADTVCPEVWKPVCSQEENLTFWNCCFLNVYSNATSFVEGVCEGDAPVFMSDEGALTSSIVVEMMPVEDTGSPAGARKLKQSLEDLLASDGETTTESAPEQLITAQDDSVPANDTEVEYNPTPADWREVIQIDTSDVLEAIIGENELRMLQTTQDYPFHSIGRFNNLGCTGFMIQDKLVVTAAHCVWDTRRDDWFTGLDFTPAKNGDIDDESEPFGVFEWDFAYIPWQFSDNKDIGYDFALVILKESFTEVCEKLGREDCGFIEYDTECLDRNLTLNIAGYREDILGAEEQKRMWVSPCQNVAVNCNSKAFSHTCDTTAGMAGAPLWVFRPSENGKPAMHSVRGIHIGVDSEGRKVNRAVTLNQDNFDRIQKWSREAESRM